MQLQLRHGCKEGGRKEKEDKREQQGILVAGKHMKRK